MTVKDLRLALVGVPDELEVIIRVDTDDAYFVGTPGAMSHTYGCDDESFFAIDCGEGDE